MSYFKPTSYGSLRSILPEILGTEFLASLAGQVVSDICYDPSALSRFPNDSGGLKVYFSAGPFINYQGRETPPNSLLEHARRAGADILLYEPDAVYPAASAHRIGDSYLFPVQNCRTLLARAASRFYDVGDTAVIGITGTKGKTSVSYAIHTLIRQLFPRTGLVGTASYFSGENEIANLSFEINGLLLSCLESLELAGFAASNGLDVLVVEATSHALALERVSAPLGVSSALVTNLEPEHLDFHKSFESYRRAKATVIDLVAGYRGKWPRFVVLNGNDEHAPYFFDHAREAGLPREDIIVVSGTSSKKYLEECDYSYSSTRSNVRLEHRDAVYSFTRPSGPEFITFNRIFATAFVDAFSKRLSIRASADFDHNLLLRLPGAPGRFEVVSTAPLAIVDYAHEPLSMRTVLAYLRDEVGPPIVVFSACGDRDRKQRVELARVVGEHAACIVLTTESSGSEPLEQILGDLLLGLENHPAVEVIADRQKALERGAELLAENESSCLISCGVGSEPVLRLGERMEYWNERENLEHALRKSRARCTRTSGSEGARPASATETNA